MAKRLRWGVLSTAKIGVQKVIPAIQKSKFNEVDAIASRNISSANSAGNELGISNRYGAYEELLLDPDIDVIYNPLPNHLHVNWTIKALEAGKHVLCEKPIGLNTKEVESLIKAAKKFPHLKVMEAFMYKFHPQWSKVKELVNNGVIGDVKTVQSFFSYYNVDPKNIRNMAAIGGGALMDIGCYCISFPRFIFNEEPIKVISEMDFDPLMKTDRMTSAMMHFSSCKTSTFTCSTQLMPYQQANIYGESGHIMVEIPVNAPPDVSTRITIRIKDGSETILFDPIDQYSLQADAFSKAILENKPLPVSLQDALGNMKVIDAIVASAKIKEWISL